MGGCTLGKFNSMGGGHMNLSDYMVGRGLWKFNSMGGGVEKKVPSSPPGIFFWNSPEGYGAFLRLFACSCCCFFFFFLFICLIAVLSPIQRLRSCQDRQS